jgi:acetylornithine/N-succinyldiaminopimelate aminotransferase
MFTRKQLFFKHLAQTSQSPPALEISRADGSFVFDDSGKKYLDFISGISVSSYGHGNSKIKEAIHNQVEQHLHIMVYGEYVITPQIALVEKLGQHLPSTLQSIYLTNSGAEAVEGAMKLAKRITGRTEFVSFKNSYHGSTQGALSICGNEILKNAFRPLLPGHHLLELNRYDQLETIGKETAAVFIEPIMAEAGILIPEKKFLEDLRKKCNAVGTLLVFDEIQTGMGRTGSLFAFEELNIVPDILLLGKAFGGGMPLGAFISSNEKMETLTHDPVLGHLTTSGGHPVSCAAALAGLEILTSTVLLATIKKKEEIVRKHLRHKQIRDIRGKGLLLAIEFDNEMINRKVIQCCFDNGLLTDWFLFAPACLRIAPPLTINETELQTGCEIILDAIEKT